MREPALTGRDSCHRRGCCCSTVLDSPEISSSPCPLPRYRRPATRAAAATEGQRASERMVITLSIRLKREAHLGFVRSGLGARSRSGIVSAGLARHRTPPDPAQASVVTRPADCVLKAEEAQQRRRGTSVGHRSKMAGSERRRGRKRENEDWQCLSSEKRRGMRGMGLSETRLALLRQPSILSYSIFRS